MITVFFLLGVMLIVVAMFFASDGKPSSFLFVGLGWVFLIIALFMSADQNKKAWMDKCIQHELEYKCEALYR